MFANLFKTIALPFTQKAVRCLLKFAPASWQTPTAITVHRIGENTSNPQIDVVFVHGLWGRHDTTWRSTKLQWPPMLGQLPDVVVWAVDYPTVITAWLAQKIAIPSLAHTIAHALISKGMGQRPVIFVGHSMGGLVIKEMLTAQAGPGQTATYLQGACAGVVFCGTPHHGSNYLMHLAPWWWKWAADTHLEELQKNAPNLARLNDAFGYFLQSAEPKVPVLNYCETQAILGAVVVPTESANPGLQDLVQVFEMPCDHQQICKPTVEDDLRIEALKHLIQDGVARGIKGRPGKPVLLSYAWADQEAAKACESLYYRLYQAGLPVLCDWPYRLDSTVPAKGWKAWRNQVLNDAGHVLVVIGEHYVQSALQPSTQPSQYQGLIYSESELCTKGLTHCMPLLPDGCDASTRIELMPAFLEDRYNGMQIPSGISAIIQRLCGRIAPPPQGARA